LDQNQVIKFYGNGINRLVIETEMNL